jgi:hypothetical protein
MRASCELLLFRLTAGMPQSFWHGRYYHTPAHQQHMRSIGPAAWLAWQAALRRLGCATRLQSHRLSVSASWCLGFAGVPSMTSACRRRLTARLWEM